MVGNYESGNTVLRVWLLLHRVRDAISLCEDSVVRKYGLTAEQWQLLASVKSYGGSLKITELSLILERSPNSVSMLVDRMVRAGLVKRVRDRSDRRVVHVSLTSKGENAVGPATPAGWELIQKILSPLSHENKQALAGMLETVKCEAVSYLNPEVSRAEIVRTSSTNQPDLYERMVNNVFPSGSEPVVRVGKKKRPYNKGD